MFVVGLTGGIGSGKTTVSDRFAERGVPLVDTDLLAHKVTHRDGAAMPLIRQEFGDAFVARDGSLDRAHMRALVFADPAARARLEAMTHPLILLETRRAIARADGPYVMLVSPLLIESGNWKERVDRVAVVDCACDTQIARVIARNGFTREQVLAIMVAQASRATRLAAADDVIVNDGDAATRLDKQVAALHRVYLAHARRGK